ncbi:AAA family ATPase [Candidatus Saccharibacteria bacterium]|nr:AAA family ATPase [Candidatus Saccharibacteria bacterium]
MTIDEAYHLVQQKRPQLIHISGKTCTGKSTFASKLAEASGYEIIELDQVVNEHVIKPMGIRDHKTAFVEIYKDDTNRKLIDAFLTATRKLIEAKHTTGQPLIIDGAVANTTTLQALFAGYTDFLFLYFHPVHLDAYERNITSRFIQTTEDYHAGLPKRLWELVDKAEFISFCSSRELSPALESSIRQYATSSAAESKKRLTSFEAAFSDIVVAEL